MAHARLNRGRPPSRVWLIRSETGLTVVEVLVASVILIIGVLGTFMMLDVSNRAAASARAREGATGLAREVLENARSVPFGQIGPAGWFQQRLVAMPNGSGTVSSPTSYTQQTTVSRRGFVYTVAVSACSLDDGKDGYGAHAAGTRWCSDSASTGTADGQAEDLKRVTADVSYSVAARTQTVQQTATFSSSGAAVGPTVTALSITSPGAYAGQASPVVTSTPTGGILSFTGTSVGAAEMRFTINGAEQPTGVTNLGSGNWRLDWNISSLKDGSYTVGAVAVDALGTRGQPRTMQVNLNRGAASALAGAVGGYNFVNVSGTRTLVLEGTWDANPEGNVTGYQVLRGLSVVCATSVSRSCIDFNPPTTGSTTYTIKTWYRDSSGTLQSISTNFPVTAPATGPFPTRYYLTADPSNATGSFTGAGCHTASGSGTRLDMRSSAPAFSSTSSGSGWVSGCLPQFPAAVAMSAGTMTVNTKWINTSSSDCNSMPVYLYLNGATLIAGTGINGGGSLARISNNTTAGSPASISKTFTTSARTFSAGDQLSRHTPSSTFGASCAGVSLYFNSAANSVDVTLPLTGPGVTSLAQPAAPTGLTATANGDGTTTLTWIAASGTPAPEFYRIYRDGQNYTNRIDTAGDEGTATSTWTDTATGGTTHSYYVTTATAALTESATMAGPVSG